MDDLLIDDEQRQIDDYQTHGSMHEEQFLQSETLAPERPHGINHASQQQHIIIDSFIRFENVESSIWLALPCPK
jgi:hypothetical protein